MRITIVASSIIPGNSLGIEHFTYGLINALYELFPENEYVILIPSGTLDIWKFRVAPKSKISYIQMHLSPGIRESLQLTKSAGFAKLYDFLKNQKLARLLFGKLRQIELRRILVRLKPDIVYSPFHVEKLAFGTWKTVLSVHDIRELMTEFFDREGAYVLKRNIRLSDSIIVAWKHPYDQVRDMFPLQRSKTYLVPFPVPITTSEHVSEIPRGRKEIVLYASALREHKNHIRLLRAMPTIIKARSLKHKEVVLLCVGTCHSPIYEHLIEEVTRLGIDDNVKFTGFISDAELGKLYEQSTMIVTPTLWEAASGSVFEAFAFGKPVACSRIPPIESQVKQFNAFAKFFDPYDAKDISQAVIEVLDNPEPFIEGSRRGSKFLRSLSWEKTATSYMRIFRSLVVK